MALEPAAQPLKVEDAKEIAAFYHVPPSLMNMMFVIIGGNAYAKQSFLLFLGHKKGISRIEVSKPEKKTIQYKDKDGKEHTGDEYTCEAKIYPIVTARTLEAVHKYTEEERKKIMAYLMEPTIEWGRASPANVRMSTMQQWLDAIAIKRAVCRALRLFAGMALTSFEELPLVTVTDPEGKEARDLTTT